MSWKTFFAVTIALALAGPGVAYAQKPPLPLEDRAAVVDARIAAHKAALKLTPEQEKNWPGYEAALRKLAKLRVERYQEQKSTNPRRTLAPARRGFERCQRGVEAAGRCGGAAI